VLTALVTSSLQVVPTEEYKIATYLINGLIVASILSMALAIVSYADHKTRKAGAKAVIFEKTEMKLTSGGQGGTVQVELVIRNPHSVPLGITTIYGALHKDHALVGSLKISDNISIAPLSSATVGKSFGLGDIGGSNQFGRGQPDAGNYVFAGTMHADTVYGKSIVRFRMQAVEAVPS
jgi:hypothetical protein